ncbi:hypothetical protein GGH95_000866 [Coemansia sp. RSA 1836]|nr:hypothetical protein GGH95_000866 [Coemansia sp. RSA 1836]
MRSTLQLYPATWEQYRRADSAGPHAEQQMASTAHVHPAPSAREMTPARPYLDPGFRGQLGRSEWPTQARFLLQAQSTQHCMRPATMQLLNNQESFGGICTSPSEASADELDTTCVDFSSGAHNVSAQDFSAGIVRAQLPPQAAIWRPCEQLHLSAMALRGGPEALAPQQSMPANVEFRDAANSVLFRESLSLDYPLDEVFYLYYPAAPRSLMFYLEGNVALPKSTTLNTVFSMCNNKHTPVIIWARIPVIINPERAPQWS